MAARPVARLLGPPRRRSGWGATLVVAAVGLVAGVAGAAPDCIVLADFALGPERAFPGEWQVRREDGRAVYSVLAENGVHFLRAAAQRLGIQAARPREWDLREYPILAWRWRPRQFPRGANEQTGKNDSALAVYAVFPYNPFAVKSLKYIWSEKVPKGTQLESSRGLTQVLVLESGPAASDAWVEERVDVAADYHRRFHDEALPRPAGIAVLTDSDDTESYAEGDYADFKACRR